MVITSVKLQSTHDAQVFELPFTHEELCGFRTQWHAWLAANNNKSIEDASSSNGVCLSVIDNDATRRLNGFDRLILARFVVAKKVRFV